jgi:predicted house-cleaning NTP pyrophosphatase (Maf/HAM1 superfamily)
MKVVLASASPRRHELLKEIFAEFEIHPAAADEILSAPLPKRR